jgi:hypothetical protein
MALPARFDSRGRAHRCLRCASDTRSTVCSRCAMQAGGSVLARHLLPRLAFRRCEAGRTMKSYAEYLLLLEQKNGALVPEHELALLAGALLDGGIAEVAGRRATGCVPCQRRS